MPRNNQPACLRRGFTLIELLVAIGIILLLAGLLLPMALRAMRSGERTKAAADLQAIATALEAYRTDHGDYPRVLGDPVADPDVLTGAQILVRALIAPGPAEDTGSTPGVFDGADGPGFRVRGTQGRVYGPYLKVDQFTLRDPAALTDSALDLDAVNPVIVDVNNKPILYFPARPGRPNVAAGAADFEMDEAAFYDARDNVTLFKNDTENETDATARLQVMVGASGYSGPFLLWSAGPDGVFGTSADAAPDTTVLDHADALECDDVTNFNVAP